MYNYAKEESRYLDRLVEDNDTEELLKEADYIASIEAEPNE